MGAAGWFAVRDIFLVAALPAMWEYASERLNTKTAIEITGTKRGGRHRQFRSNAGVKRSQSLAHVLKRSIQR